MQYFLKLFFLSGVIIFCFTVCKQQKKQPDTSVNNAKQISNTPNAASSGFEKIDTNFYKIDSMVFVFYKNPFGSDSLRYSRFYKQYPTNNSGIIDYFKKSFQSVIIDTTEQPRPYRNEGKIWCFAKGKPIQTVYFNRQCPDHGCFYYIIYNGWFYYLNMPEQDVEKLNTIQTKAVEPK